ncbi:hypothetical protein [Microbacterium rhizophilus]|uniref:hypothetical protein n=1 Tax=Microbacterium rhizophilus TaxID=3138934 RepID=UPI0031E9B728
MPINIDFLANVSRLLRGTEDVETAFEGVADSLDDLAQRASSSDLEGSLRDSERAADDLESALESAAREGGQVGDKLKAENLPAELRDGEQAAGKLERGFKDLADAAKDSSKAGKKIGDDVEDGTRRASEGIDEMKGESQQTAREMAASFSGEPADALEALQEVAANALGGFGPLGAAAGIAIALGIGLGMKSLDDLSTKINEAKEQAGQLAIEWEQATEEERVASLAERWDELSTKIADSREWWEVWQDSAITAIEQVADVANSNADIAARFTDAFNVTDPIERQRELADVLDTLNTRVSDLNDGLADNDVAAHNNADSWTALLGISDEAALKRAESRELLDEERAALEKLRPEIEQQLEVQTQQNLIQEARAEALGMTTEAYEEYRKKVAETAQAEEAYGSALEQLADPVAVYDALLQQQQDKARETAEAIAESTDDQSDSWEDYAEDAKVSTQQLIDTWNEQARQAAQFEQSLAIIAAAGGDALARELAAKGPAVAGAVAEVIATSSPEQQREAIQAHARATGGAVSDNIGAGVRANSGAVQRGVNDAIGSVYAPDIPARFHVENPQYAVDSAARSVVPPTIWLNIGARKVEVFQ